MTLVKCPNCGAERDLSYDQIEVVNREERHCPSCGVGKERVVVREEKFRPFSEFLAQRVVEGGRTAAVNLAEVYGVADPTPTGPEKAQEPDVPENTGISVGPGGAIGRRRRPAKPEE